MSTSQRKNHLIIHISESEPLSYDTVSNDNNVYIHIKCNSENTLNDKIKCLGIEQKAETPISLPDTYDSIVTVLKNIIDEQYDNFFKIILYGENNKIIADIFNAYIDTLPDDNTILSKIIHKNNKSNIEQNVSRDDIIKEVEKKLENHNNLMKRGFNEDKYGKYLEQLLSRLHTNSTQNGAGDHSPDGTDSPHIVNLSGNTDTHADISNAYTPKIINKIYIIYMTDDVTTSKHGVIYSKKKKKNLRKIRNIYKISSNTEEKLNKRVHKSQDNTFLYTIKNIPDTGVTKLNETWWYKEYTKVPKCANGRLRQFTGTCWFNSVINLLLLTPQLAKMLKDKYIQTYNTSSDSNIIESKKRVEFDFNTIDFGKNEINKSHTSNDVETVSNIVFLHDENNTPYTVPENLYVLIYNLLIKQNKPATKSNFMTVIANGIVINGISKKFQDKHNSKKTNAEGGQSEVLLRFIFDTLFLEDNDAIKNKYIRSNKENDKFDILYLTHDIEYYKETPVTPEIELNKNIEDILFNYYISLNKDKKGINIINEITNNTNKLDTIKKLNEKFIKYIETLEDDKVLSILTKFGIENKEEPITNNNFTKFINHFVVQINKESDNFVIDKSFIEKYSLYKYSEDKSKDRNVIIIHYPFGYYENIPKILKYLDNEYELSGSIIKPFNGHVIAGLKCYDKSYVFDANNIITECDWDIKTNRSYYEEATLVYPDIFSETDLSEYKFNTYILIYIKKGLDAGFYGGTNYMYEQLQYKNKYLKYKNKYMTLKNIA